MVFYGVYGFFCEKNHYSMIQLYSIFEAFTGVTRASPAIGDYTVLPVWPSMPNMSKTASAYNKRAFLTVYICIGVMITVIVGRGCPKVILLLEQLVMV